MFKKSNREQNNDKDITKSFIAPGVELDATLFKSTGSVAISGTFKGRLDVAQDTELLSEGVIIGDIFSNNAIISGNTKATINCSGFLEIAQTANIEGDIVASSIEVEHGAIINGKISVNPKQINSLKKDQ